MNDESDVDPFTEALRADLPSSEDEARLRLRLVSAGVLAGVGVVAPSATAAATGAAATGIVSKLVALPLAVKIGASLVVASAVAVPLVRSRTGPEHAARAVVFSAASRSPLLPRTAGTTATDAVDGARETVKPAPPRAAADATANPAEPSSEQPPGAAAHEADVASGPEASARGASRAAHTVRVQSTSERVQASAVTTESKPSVASFAVAPAPVVDEGTLRAETALMERALAASKRGDLAEARRLLVLHASQFPNGHLAPERERALARIGEKEKKP